MRSVTISPQKLSFERRTEYLFGNFWIIWELLNFQIILSHCFNGVPGEIRTPDLVVRSHAFENAFHTMIYDTIVQWLSQIILSFKEFPAYNGGIPYLIWDDKGVTTVGFSL